MYDRTPLTTFTYHEKTVGFRSDDLELMFRSASEAFDLLGGRWMMVARNDYVWVAY